jgi:hypothetical protein
MPGLNCVSHLFCHLSHALACLRVLLNARSLLEVFGGSACISFEFSKADLLFSYQLQLGSSIATWTAKSTPVLSRESRSGVDLTGIF